MSQLSNNLTKNVSNFIEGNVNFFLKEKIPKHYQEQAEHRAKLCAPCSKAGKCIGADGIPGCGCKTPNMFYAPDKTCPAKK